MLKAGENKIFFHVMHSREDGKWHIKPGNEGTIVSYDSKEKAVSKATELAQSARDRQRYVIVHKTNGAFETVKNLL